MFKIVLLFFTIIAIFYFFGLDIFAPNISDGNIYINMGKAVANGLFPYKDFFFAHPPIQIYLYALFFKIFGASLFTAKFFSLFISFLCLILMYFITKDIFGKKEAEYSSIFFLIFPAFFIFAPLSMGMFEASFFYLISLIFLVRKRYFLSSLFFSLAFFTRYLIILLFPFNLFLAKNKKKLFIYTFFQILIPFLILGKSFITDTIIYHLSQNIKMQIQPTVWLDQYFALGIFTTFLVIYLLSNKDKKIRFASICFIFYNLIVLLIFKQIIYHYFIPSLFILFPAVGRAYYKDKLLISKIFILTVISLSLLSNIHSFVYHYSKERNTLIFKAIEFILKYSDKDDKIFGDPRIINLVSFITDRKIAGNFFDSDFKFVEFYGREKFFSEVEKEKPKLILATQYYSPILFQNYETVESVDNDLYVLKRLANK
ncbi:MAG: glycosyltransferase family 39 protein [Candidatus Aenigmatarchaeota archaeon]